MPDLRRARGVARTALLIARRYMLARSHGYATFINWVSFASLMLGVMTLTVVVSVMNGFDREITGRLLSIVPHAVVEPAPHDVASLADLSGVRHASRFFSGEAMLAAGGTVHFITLAGLDAAGLEQLGTGLGQDALADLRERSGGIVLGAPLARAKRLAPGDSVTLVIAVPTSAGVRPQVERFVLAGTFEIGADPDAGLGLVHHEEILLRGLAGAGVDGARLVLDDPLAAPLFAPELAAAIGAGSRLRLWVDDYGELFRAVQVEKAIMFVLLALIVGIAAFNTVSGQAMLVNDKRADIAVLTTMGASPVLVGLTFYLQGFAVAVLGIAVGLGLGVLVADNASALVALLEALGASVIEDTWFTEVPSEIRGDDLAIIGALSLGLSTVAVLVPAFRAAKGSPIAALQV